MAEPLEIWVGKDEFEGIPVPERVDLEPPPHWRLEAVVATERPHSLTMSADRRRAIFVQDRDTSDVWLLDLGGGVPDRVTTGRELAAYWDDTAPRLSPDGRTVAYVGQGHVWLAPAEGGPSRRLVEAGGPVWVDDATLVVSVERDRASRLAVVDAADAWPRPLASAGARGDEYAAAVSPDGTSVAYAFTPRDDLERSELRVADLGAGTARAITGTPRVADRFPAWSPDGVTIAYASDRSGWGEVRLVGADGTEDRALTEDHADFSELEFHPDGTRLVAIRSRRGRSDLVTVGVDTGEVELVAAGGWWGCPHWTADGSILATYEDQGTAPQLRLVRPGGEPATVHAPTPVAVRRAPHVRPEDVTFESLDGLEIHACLFRPPGTTEPAPAVVYPHGGPISCYGDEWDGLAQYFLDKGYGWLALNFRGSTGYGSEFRRLNHGDWGIGDTKDCLAAADFLRGLDWVDGDRLAIMGASYGSYLALLSVTDDPEYRYRCAVCKYGDCDILTSWAQAERGATQELELMMGHPSTARAAYRAGSPVHRLENVRAPILVAHGELDDIVSPKQSEELVAELRRLGKTFEYVTYPTEAHGLLRAGPQLHFYRRMERFLDWYLL